MLDPAQARVRECECECGYLLCNAPADGWSREHPPNRTKLTDEALPDFILCDKCRSIVCCSEACRDADKTTACPNMWDAEERTHEEICEPYLDND